MIYLSMIFFWNKINSDDKNNKQVTFYINQWHHCCAQRGNIISNKSQQGKKINWVFLLTTEIQ